jgi:hypothetical protein
MRPTDLIRDLLVMRLVQQAAKREENRLMEEMKDNAVQIIEVEDRPVDFYVRFKDNGWEHEFYYPRSMLVAEAAALWKLWRRRRR